MKKNIIISLLLLYSIISTIFIGILFYERILFNSRNFGGGVAEKPVIYLYPEKKQNVLVKLGLPGNLIYSYPQFDEQIGGWEVEANPDGILLDKEGKSYNYLFWESTYLKELEIDEKVGFVVKGEDTVEFLEKVLPKIGLNPKEYNEFIIYWAPKMEKNNYNFIHFMGDKYGKAAPLNITPTPDNILRVFMVFKSLDINIQVKPQTFTEFNRKGFTVVEWGGMEIK